jgi:hypothetical protein
MYNTGRAAHEAVRGYGGGAANLKNTAADAVDL